MKQADGHHDEIGHHLVVANERSERFYHAPDLIEFVFQFAIGLLGSEVPVPSVFECRDLRRRIAPRFVTEQNVVIAVRVKRRVEINEIDGIVLDIIPQDLEIVAVVKSVHYQ